MQHPLDMPMVRLRQKRRLGFRVRLLMAIKILLIVAGGAIFWTLEHTTVLPTSSWETKRLPELGIQFSYPTSWHLQRFDEMTGHARITGALVSNVDHGFEHPEGTSAYDMRGLDDGVVVLSFQQLDRFNTEGKETVGFPLSLDQAEEVIDAETYGAPQPRYTIYFGVEGYLRSAVQVWIGDVTPEEGTAIERILASVEPLSH
jgi:hypothetical protein